MMTFQSPSGDSLFSDAVQGATQLNAVMAVSIP